MTSPRLLSSIAIPAVLVLITPSFAGDAPSDSNEEQALVLPDFHVTGSAISEYAAAESITGTRVATKLRDLPFTVNVVTGDFLDDFAAFEFRDQFGYTSSVSVWETLSTGYSVRGFDADVQLRNGFRRIGLIDKVNVERAEVIKGPAASIYGTVLPGGTINIITRKPSAKPEQRFSVYAGSNDLRRARFSSTGPVGSSRSLFYRIDLAADENDYDAPYKHKEQQTGSVQLLWKLKEGTSLLVEYEDLRRTEDGIASTSIPFIRQSVQDPYRNPGRNYSRYSGLALDMFPELYEFNIQGPKNYSDRYVKNVTATFEHRINSTFSLRSSANWFDRGLERVEVGGRDRVDLPSGLIPTGIPRIRPFPEGGASWQTDLLARWETGGLKHTTLVTADYQRQTEEPERWDMIASVRNNSAYNAAAATSGLDPENPLLDFVTYNEDPSVYSLAQKEDNSIDLYGVFVSHRTTFAEDRALLMAGMRYDRFERHARDLVAGDDEVRRDSEISYQVGANYRLFPAVTLFTNTSRSFVPQFSIGRDLGGSTYDLPSEIGRGWEVGVKAEAFRGRLTFTGIYYDIERSNVARDATDPATGVIYTTLSGTEASKGFELDFNWVATDELQFFGGFGYNDTEIVDHVVAPHLIGTPLRRAPKSNFGVGLKYDIKQGALKGLFATAGVRHYDKSLINPSTGRAVSKTSVTASNPFHNVRMPNGLLPFPQFDEGAVLTSIPYAIRLNDGRESIFNDAYTWVEAGLGYRWTTEYDRKLRHTIQLNIRNLTDERYTYGSAGPGPGREFILSYDLRF